MLVRRQTRQLVFSAKPILSRELQPCSLLIIASHRSRLNFKDLLAADYLPCLVLEHLHLSELG